ncbi:hypothetical protein DFH11DRAFT_648919 [Phellopilus nigrolimitatus]|nr:hypothetical protein DFH11DRAFT_648919 [Phellopilus nigrolimitatus]
MASECAGNLLCEEVATLAQAFRIIQWTKLSNLSALALLSYDFIVTLDGEYALMWNASFGLGKVLFLAIRYAHLFTIIIINLVLFLPEASSEVSVSWVRFQWVARTVLANLAELALQLGIYALYNKNRKILLLLITSFSTTFIAMLTLSIKVLLHEKNSFYDFGSGQDMHMCVPINLSSYFREIWIPLLVHEALLLGLVLYKAIESMRTHGVRGSMNRITIFLVRDSVMYFFIVFITYLASQLIWALGGANYIEIPVCFAISMGGIMSQRLLLNIRQQFLDYNPALLSNGSGSSLGVRKKGLQVQMRSRTTIDGTDDHDMPTGNIMLVPLKKASPCV